jgi:hypothetical protein
MKARFVAFWGALMMSFFTLFTPAHAEGMGEAAVKAVQEAAKDANPVYVAVIAALAGFFVVKLIRKAL